MKTMQKIVLCAAAGAALLGGALGCGKKESVLETSLEAGPKIEALSEQYKPAQEVSATRKSWFVHLDAIKRLPEEHQKFQEQLDITFKALDEAMEFDRLHAKEIEEDRQRYRIDLAEEK